MTNSQHARTRTARYLFALAIDALLLVAAGVVAFVALTGGTVFTTGGTRISVTTTGNPIALAAALAGIRYFYLPSIPLFGASRWTPAHLDGAAAFLLARLGSTHDRLPSRVRAVLISTLIVSTGLRLINAWAHPGFTTGDDVEIHEMTLGRLFGASPEAWNLRSALYPLGFVYPLQALAYSVVGDDVRMLVFAGRVGVVVFATVAVWLVYRVTLHLTRSSATALLAAILLATSRLHLWFGSSELPRPVASVFVLAGFWALISGPGAGRAAVSGVLLGVGGALRFGELVFFAPAWLHLAVERRWRDGLVLGAAGTATAAACLGVTDWFYWGRPFFSLINVVDYTLVQRASSRGFQPPWYYFSNANDWTNFVFLAFGLLAIVAADRRVALWTWVPVLLLSLLPHKEARYVIPVLPFLCIAVAVALGSTRALHTPRRKTLAVFAVAVAVLFEFSNWHFHRSDDAVRLAQQINLLRPSGVAAQQLWRFGGSLYLSDVNGPLVDIHEPVDPAEFLEERVQLVVLLREFASPRVRGELMSRGFDVSDALSTSRYVTFAQR